MSRTSICSDVANRFDSLAGKVQKVMGHYKHPRFNIARLSRTLFSTSVAVLVFTFVVSNALCQSDTWYESVKYIHRDPYSFASSYASTLFPNTGIQIGYKYVSSGYIYAILSQAATAEICSQPNQAKIIDSTTIKTHKDVEVYRSFVAKQIDTPQVPYWVGAVALVPSAIPLDLIAPEVFTLMGAAPTFMDALLNFSDSKSRRTTARELASFMAVGGTFQRFVVLTEAEAQHKYLNVNIVYQVTMSNVPRSVVISSDTYALKVESGTPVPGAAPPMCLIATVQ